MKHRILTPKPVCGTPEQQLFYAQRLQKMLACATVSHKTGHEDTEFAKLRATMAELFPLVHARAEKLTFSDDCWLYRLPGKNASHSIVLMSHHDVAAVTNADVWKFDAFSGEIAAGCIWGRGAVDTKTPLFAEFSAVEELLSEGVEPPCTVYLASSHNEEIAGDGMPQVLAYFVQNNIFPDFVLDEGGALIDPPLPGMACKCAMLAVHEKGRHALLLTAQKTPEHTGLLASHVTPPLQMAQFIMDIEQKQPFVRKFSPPVLAMFRELSPYTKQPLRFVFGHVNAFQGLLKRVIPKMNPQAGAMLGTTYNFTTLATDTVSGACTATMFLRCIDDRDLAREIERVQTIAAARGIAVQSAPAGNEYHKPADLNSAGYLYVKRCVEQAFPYAACAPFILPAGSDARQFSDICPAVVRFAPIDITAAQLSSVHGTDENIALDTLPRAVAFYKNVVRGYSPVTVDIDSFKAHP